MAESKTRRALKKKCDAQVERKIAREYAELGDMVGAGSYHITAGYMEREAAALAEPTSTPRVSAGEVLPEAPDIKSQGIRDTLRSPDSAAVDASIARTSLLLQSNADITALAVDAAASIDADNSLEKMLAHQLAAAHAATMKLMNQAASVSQEVHDGLNPQRKEAANVQATRLFNSGSRLMATFQQGLLALNKIRNRGNQTVTVQHVHVSEGGQAVIGNLDGGGGNATGANTKKDDTP